MRGGCRMARRVHQFVVAGSGKFPADMLHCGRCWPASKTDVAYVEGRPRTRRFVSLHGLDLPDGVQWEVHGWAVLSVDNVPFRTAADNRPAGPAPRSLHAGRRQ